uniref:WRKY transcription factor 84 n=1 Tax=Rhizophora mucronata TaxID=61149 RepID=A0A2P2PP37_RHIMU
MFLSLSPSFSNPDLRSHSGRRSGYCTSGSDYHSSLHPSGCDRISGELCPVSTTKCES